MSLNYSILQNKPKIKLKDKNGNIQEMYDLLPQTMVSMELNNSMNKCIVNKYYVARPDLISLAFYGTDEFADIICKLNGISNPFELNEDDMLTIPFLEHINFYSRPNKQISELASSNKNIGEPKVSKQKSLDKKRSPNEQVVGDKNYLIDKSLGLVFY
jgi:hypothetical protein